ncbi:MAG: hypothetical protein K2P93_05375 [Alphaproteobacteria bacterium]|nr:hypothetical protein [Alphaproteobacteria bacterium]
MPSKLEFKKLFLISTSLIASVLTSTSLLMASGKDHPHALEESEGSQSGATSSNPRRESNPTQEIDIQVKAIIATRSALLAQPFLNGTYSYATYQSDNIRENIIAIREALEGEFPQKSLEKISTHIPYLLIHHMKESIADFSEETFRSSLLAFLKSYRKYSAVLNDNPRRMLLSLVCAVASDEENLRKEGFKIAKSIPAHHRTFSDWLAYFALSSASSADEYDKLISEINLYKEKRHSKVICKQKDVLSDVTALFMFHSKGAGMLCLKTEFLQITEFEIALYLMHIKRDIIPLDKLEEDRRERSSIKNIDRQIYREREFLEHKHKNSKDAHDILNEAIVRYETIAEDIKIRLLTNPNSLCVIEGFQEQFDNLRSIYRQLFVKATEVSLEDTLCKTTENLETVKILYKKFKGACDLVYKTLSPAPVKSMREKLPSSLSSPSPSTTAEIKREAALLSLLEDKKNKRKDLTPEQKARKKEKKKAYERRKKEKERAVSLAVEISSPSLSEERPSFPALKKSDLELFKVIYKIGEGKRIHNFTMSDLTSMLTKLGCRIDPVKGENAIIVSSETSSGPESVKLHNPHGRSETDALYPALIDQFVIPFLERIGANPDTVPQQERGASQSPTSRSPTNKSPRTGTVGDHSGPKSGRGSATDKGEADSHGGA